jgi:predicted AAA+ superfamily ATPase
MQNRDTSISELCEELGGITKQTLYRYVSPTGELRYNAKKLLNK